MTPTTFWDYSDVGHTDGSNKELKNLFDSKQFFDYPKPIELLKRSIQIGANSDNIILDFFSGSATTAHATMQLNAEDGGNRKYILVQLPEPCKEDSEAFKAGYSNICEIGKERIRRAGKKILEERSFDVAQGAKKKNVISIDSPLVISTEVEKSTLLKEEKKDVSTTLDMTKDLDIGFKVLKLDSSNIKEWDPLCHENLEKSLFESVDNIKSDRTSEDVLYEIFIKYGLPLTVSWNVLSFEGKRFISVGAGNLVVCLESVINRELVHAMIEYIESTGFDNTTVILKELGLGTDTNKTNILQQLKQAKINDVKCV